MALFLCSGSLLFHCLYHSHSVHQLSTHSESTWKSQFTAVNSQQTLRFKFQVFPFLWRVEVGQVYLVDRCVIVLWLRPLAWDVLWSRKWGNAVISGGKVRGLHWVETVNGVPRPCLQQAYIRSSHEVVTETCQRGVAVNVMENGVGTY